MYWSGIMGVTSRRALQIVEKKQQFFFPYRIGTYLPCLLLESSWIMGVTSGRAVHILEKNYNFSPPKNWVCFYFCIGQGSWVLPVGELHILEKKYITSPPKNWVCFLCYIGQGSWVLPVGELFKFWKKKYTLSTPIK